MKNKLMILAGLLSLSVLTAMEPLPEHEAKVDYENRVLQKIAEMEDNARTLRDLVKITDRLPNEVENTLYTLGQINEKLGYHINRVKESANRYPKN